MGRILSVLFISALATVQAQADEPGLSHWVDQQARIVYFAPRALVKVTVLQVAADDEYWDMMSVELSYPGEIQRTHVQELSSQYPGYAFRHVIMDREGDFRLSIAGTGIDHRVTPLPGDPGPYFNETLFISKTDSQSVRAALARPDAVSVEGSVGLYVPTLRNRVVETLRKDYQVEITR